MSHYVKSLRVGGLSFENGEWRHKNNIGIKSEHRMSFLARSQ